MTVEMALRHASRTAYAVFDLTGAQPVPDDGPGHWVWRPEEVRLSFSRSHDTSWHLDRVQIGGHRVKKDGANAAVSVTRYWRDTETQAAITETNPDMPALIAQMITLCTPGLAG